MTTSYRELLSLVVQRSPVLMDVDIQGQAKFLGVLRTRHPDWFKTFPSLPNEPKAPPSKPKKRAPPKPQAPPAKPAKPKPPAQPAKTEPPAQPAKPKPPAQPAKTEPPAQPAQPVEMLLSPAQIIENAKPVIPEMVAIEMAGRYEKIPWQVAFAEEEPVVTTMDLDPWENDDGDFSDAVDPEQPDAQLIATKEVIVVDDDQTIIIEDDAAAVPVQPNAAAVNVVVIKDDEAEGAPPADDVQMLEIHAAYHDAAILLFKTMMISQVTRVVQDARWSPGIRREYYLVGNISRSDQTFYVYLVESNLKSKKFGIFMSKLRAPDDGDEVGVHVSNLLLGLVINDNIQKLLQNGRDGGFDLKDIDMHDADAYAGLKAIIESKKRTTQLVRMTGVWGAFVNDLGLEAEPVARCYQDGQQSMLLGKAAGSNAFFLTYVLDEDAWTSGVTREEIKVFTQLTKGRTFAAYPVLSRAVF